MVTVALTAKAALAVMLLIAGAAKLADLPSFASAVRLVLTFRAPATAVRATALAAAVTELALGAASLSLPRDGWLNPCVFVLACGFVAVSGIGYVFHRDRSCRCFGALSQRTFDVLGIVRSLAIAAAAALTLPAVPAATITVSAAGRILLFLAGTVVAVAAFSAARALGLTRRLEPEKP